MREEGGGVGEGRRSRAAGRGEVGVEQQREEEEEGGLM